MNSNSFLKTLIDLFPSDDSEEVIEERLLRYKKVLTEKEKSINKKIDYDRTLNLILEKYPYRSFPNCTEIMKYLRFFPAKDELESPRKFEVKIGNRTYEFTEVPSSWEGAHNLSEFDNYVLI